MKDTIKVGIVGCGSIVSTVHLPILANIPEVELVYFADLQTPKKLAERYKTRAVKLPATIADLPSCDVAFICTPVGAREEYIKEYARQNAFIFTEKPFAVGAVQHEQFLGLSSRMSCNYMKLFYGTVRQMRDIVSSGIFGPLRRVVVTEGGVVGATGKATDHYQTNVGLSGGGIVTERGCHTLSQLCYILQGSTLDVVSSEIIRQDDLDVDATVQMQARGEIDCDIDYHVSLIKPEKDLARFIFDTCEVSFEHMMPTCSLQVTNRSNSKSAYTIEQSNRWATEWYLTFYLKWLDVLEQSRKTTIDVRAQTSFDTTRLIEDIYKLGSAGYTGQSEKAGEPCQN